MEQLSVTITGQPELSARLNRVLTRLGDLEPEFKAVGKKLTAWYAEEPFGSRGEVYGQDMAWAPLQPAYKRWKERKYPGKGILVLTGKMRDSFYYEPESFKVTIGNHAEYFAKHQLGEGVPQRVMMMLDQNRINLALSTAKSSLSTRIQEAWV